MDIISHLQEKEIPQVVYQTINAFTPLLKSRENIIREIPFQSFKFGPLDRNQLDIYYPPSVPSGLDEAPILFFCYGGGLSTGDRRLDPETFGLVYSNVAAFYARHGYIVVIPDYRLVPGVTYPGSSEDICDAIRWVSRPENAQNLVLNGSPRPDTGTIILSGQSAGGLLIISMILDGNILSWDDELRRRIKALILIGAPYDLCDISETVTPAVDQYYGDFDSRNRNGPLGLYNRLTHDITRSLPPMLVVEGENEPDWIIRGGEKFRNQVAQKEKKTLQVVIAKGHNHISTVWAPSSGEGEEWIAESVKWLQSIRL